MKQSIFYHAKLLQFSPIASGKTGFQLNVSSYICMCQTKYSNAFPFHSFRWGVIHTGDLCKSNIEWKTKVYILHQTSFYHIENMWDSLFVYTRYFAFCRRDFISATGHSQCLFYVRIFMKSKTKTVKQWSGVSGVYDKR